MSTTDEFFQTEADTTANTIWQNSKTKTKTRKAYSFHANSVTAVARSLANPVARSKFSISDSSNSMSSSSSSSIYPAITLSKFTKPTIQVVDENYTSGR